MAESRTLDQWLDFAGSLNAPIALGLERMKEMIARMGIRFSCPVVTVGGTNGKGSTCAFLEAFGAAAGLKVCTHTSPHILYFSERARIGGQSAPDADLVRAMEAVEAVRGDIALTYFEYTGLAILWLFMQSKPDLVVLEIGLGGRLDAINAIDPDVSVLVSVGIDHTAYLGNTREAIGAEKAWIFRPGCPAIVADPEPPATVTDHAARIGAQLLDLGHGYRFTENDDGTWNYLGRLGRFGRLPKPALAGRHQIGNAAAAMTAYMALGERVPQSEAILREGLASAYVPCRFQHLGGRPAIVIDVGHNPHAATVLAAALRAEKCEGRTYAVFGMLQDKDMAGVVSLMASVVDRWFVSPLPGPRGASIEKLSAALTKGGVSSENFVPHASVREALSTAFAAAMPIDRILIFGSFVTVTEAIPALMERFAGKAE